MGRHAGERVEPNDSQPKGDPTPTPDTQPASVPVSAPATAVAPASPDGAAVAVPAPVPPAPPVARPPRGRLRVYFGASAGVGKTFAMLADAAARRQAGVDVVVGVIESHGWRETAAAALGFATIPPQVFESRGAKLHEFDIDAALARRPTLLLVDELSHLNVAGARHARRWQDVQELLDAGISVATTLDVQHLESLNDVVERITGVEERERVPDDILERADEVVLIDLPAEETLARLHGGTFLAPRLARAPEGFYTLPNLVALRELALRVTAERVHAQVQAFRDARLDAPMVPSRERLLVCIGPTPLSARLVRSARRMAGSLQAEWIAAFVEPANRAPDERDRAHVADNLRLAELLGAEAMTVKGFDVVDEIVAIARLRNVTKIIVGKPFAPPWSRFWRGTLVDRLVAKSGTIDVYVINGDPGDERERPRRRGWSWRSYAWAMIPVGVGTSLCWWLGGEALMEGRPPLAPVYVCLIYLFAVAVVGLRRERGPAIFAAVVSFLAFEALAYFGLLSDRFRFDRPGYLAAFAAIMAVGLLVSSLTRRLQNQIEAAYQREARTAALHAMSRDLATSRGLAGILAAAERHGGQMFGCAIAISLPAADGRLGVRQGDPGRVPPGSPDAVACQWAFIHGRPCGSGTDTFARIDGLHVPLATARGTLGVLSLFAGPQAQLAHTERRNLVEAFAHQIALAVESDNLAAQATRAELDIKTERWRNALLSSVSHGLRTPLAAITGAASGLVEQDTLLDADARRTLATTIAEESEHMAHLVRNLLDMTRLEGGGLNLKRAPHLIEDVVGGSLTVLERRLAGRELRVDVPADVPPVPLDGILIQEVLVNLIDNALKYTPPGSPLEVRARRVGDEVEVRVADRGPGIEADEREKVWDKFYRGAAQAQQTGVGLGLAICRGIVGAHGGRTWAENRAGGGAEFCFTLPMAAAGSPAASRSG